MPAEKAPGLFQDVYIKNVKGIKAYINDGIYHISSENKIEEAYMRLKAQVDSTKVKVNFVPACDANRFLENLT